MIHGMTGVAQMPRIGKLRKGSPKGARQPGNDLDRFRFTAKDGPFKATLEGAFNELYPTGNNLAVLLPYPTTEENFTAYREAWSKSQLTHRCDGEHLVKRHPRTGELVPMGQCEGCARGTCPGKQKGRLSVILPDLVTSTGVWGTVTMETGGIHDIVRIDGALRGFEEWLGRLGKTLSGTPFVLYRAPEEVGVTINGKRLRQEKHIVNITTHPEWMRQQIAGGQMMRLSQNVGALEGEAVVIETPLLADSEHVE